MRKGMHTLGAMALSLLGTSIGSAQSPIPIPPPGTPVGPANIPAHVANPTPASADRSAKPAGRKVLNTTNAQIDYRIDTIGPSGVGRVDIYMTPDRGATWVKAGEDADKQSPANVSLPGEGLFGIRLAITNGNGFGGRAPKAGDRPQFFVEVDASSPTVAIQPYEMVPNVAAIDLKWTAIDANLAAEPISIFVRGRTDSPWVAIAQNIKNDGAYRWTFPANVPPQIYMKLEVADLAGNVTKVETPTPILLDQTEPEATLVDVTPISRGNVPTVPVTPVSNPTPASLPPAVIPPTMPASLPALPPAPGLPQ